MVYEVSQNKNERQTVCVNARSEWSAVRLADAKIIGKTSRSSVLWNGLTSEIDGRIYNRPVVVGR